MSVIQNVNVQFGPTLIYYIKLLNKKNKVGNSGLSPEPNISQIIYSMLNKVVFMAIFAFCPFFAEIVQLHCCHYWMKDAFLSSFSLFKTQPWPCCLWSFLAKLAKDVSFRPSGPGQYIIYKKAQRTCPKQGGIMMYAKLPIFCIGQILGCLNLFQNFTIEDFETKESKIEESEI